MSFPIDVAFVQQFEGYVRMLAEQKTSVLRSCVINEPRKGESWAIERLGKVEASLITDRHGDTPITSTPHTRRWGYAISVDVADMLDNVDQVQLLIDPQGKYVIKHAGAIGRKLDLEILSSMQRSVSEGHQGTTLTALPAGQKIASGSVSNTVNKLISAKNMLDKAEIDDMDRFFVGSSDDITCLLDDSRVYSADNNTVRALVDGKIDTYLGFTFRRCERVADASLLVGGERMTYAFHRSAVELGVASEPRSTAGVAPTKRFSQIVYTWAQFGATRVEDEALVQIACV